MKHKIINILYVLCFIVLFCILFDKVSFILRKKTHSNDTIGTFYTLPKDSIDVVFLGSSHSFCSFSPMELWNEYGITSYNLSSGKQAIPCSYYLMKEAIRTQHPKVIVLETYTTNYSEEEIKSTPWMHQAVDGIPLNTTKLEFITEYLSEVLPPDQLSEFCFPIILYHSRWYNLNSTDITPRNTHFRGFSPRTQIKKQTISEPVFEEKALYEENQLYLEKIVSLCKENNVELLLCQTPMGVMSEKRNKKVRGRMRTVQNYAQEQGLTYINYEEILNEVGIDYSTDFSDSSHLNILGATKATHYIGSVLSSQYNLTDHRNAPDYQYWNDDYKKYEKNVNKQIKKLVGKIK